jgi:RNA polymerase sigma-70 factor (ECF subfamily)
MAKDPDAMLVRACLSGDSSAYQVLVGKYTGPLFNVTYRITHSREDAADATQSAFVKAYEKLASFDFHHRFFSWVYRIAVNEALDLAGRSGRETALVAEGATSTDDPERNCAEAESCGHLERALQALEPGERALVVLKHLQGLSYAEIGRVLDLPEKTVKSRLFSARQRLREARLAADPRARERLRHLGAMADLFRGLEPLEPPDELAAAVARALAGRHPRQRPLAAARAWVHELLVPRWRVRLAWTCAGVVVGVAIALLHPALRSSSADDVARYYGAMARPEAPAGALVELPGGRGQLSFDRVRRLLAVRLVGTADGEASALELAAPGLVLRSVEQRGAALHRASASARGVVLESGGRGWIAVAIGVPPAVARLSVRLVAGNRALFAEEIDLAAPAAGGAPTSGGPRSN